LQTEKKTMTENSEIDGLPAKILRFILREPSLALTISYLVLIIVGMFFSYAYYLRWGIDVFQYATISDFILAPFKDTIVLLFAIISILLSWLVFEFSKKMDQRFPKLSRILWFGVKPGSSTYHNFYFSSLVFGFLYYLWLSSELFAEWKFGRMLKSKENYAVEVLFHSQPEKGWVRFIQIGQLENFSLLAYPENNIVMVVPLEGNVAAIRIVSKASENLNLKSSKQ
jgi:hypothetical protein